MKTLSFNPPITLLLQGVSVAVSKLPVTFRVDSANRSVVALPAHARTGMPLYAAADFQTAAGHTDDQHLARLYQVLGASPQAVIQELVNGVVQAPPSVAVSVVSGWRAKRVLEKHGLTAQVESALAAMPGDAGADALAAWNGNADFDRYSATVLALAAALNLSESDVDSLFSEASAISL